MKLDFFTKERIDEFFRNLTDEEMEYITEKYFNKPKKAINYTRCCKSDSELLKTEKQPLPYEVWKDNLNMQKVEDTIYKIGNDYLTINDVLEMYEDYYNSF